MKKILLLFMASLLSTIAVWAQGGDPQPQIKLRTERTEHLQFYVKPVKNATVTVDWGDGVQDSGTANWNNTIYTFRGTRKGEVITLNGPVLDLDVSAETGSVANEITALEIVAQPTMERLEARGNKLTSISLAGLTTLHTLDLSKNELTTLDLTGLSNLMFFLAADNKLTNLTLGQHDKLRQVRASNNELPALNTTQELPQLSVLDVENNAVVALNLTHMPALRTLNINGNGFSAIDISSLTKLTQFYAQRNYLTTINTASNTELIGLDLSHNLLSNIDVSANKSLTSLEIGSNKLSRIDVGQLRRLQTLGVSKNEAITHLNLDNNPFLRTLKADTTSIAGLDLSATLRVDRIYIRRTRIEACALTALFKTLPSITPTGYTNIYLTDNSWRGADFSILETKQWKHDIAPDADYGTTAACQDVTLSLEVSAGGSVTLSHMGTDITSFPHTLSAGSVVNIKVNADEGYELGQIVVEVTGDDGRAIQLPISDQGTTITSASKIIATFRQKDSRKLSLKYNKPIGTTIALSLRQPVESTKDAVQIDWGNGVWTEHQVTRDQTTTSVIQGVLAGNTVRIMGSINKLGATEQGISSANLSEMSTLTEVDLYGNEIESIDLSSLKNLDILGIGYNALSSIDVSANTLLRSLSVYGNTDITTLNVQQNKRLVELNAKGLSLSSISLDHPDLEELNVHDNKLTSLNVDKLPNLKVLRMGYNKITSFAPGADLPELKLLLANHNDMTHLDMSRMPQIEQVYVADNKFQDIRFPSSNSALNYLDIADCALDACELNKIYTALPTWSPSTIGATLPVTLNNRGQSATANKADKSNTTIAKAKGWSVAAEGDGTGCTNPGVNLLTPGNGFNYYAEGDTLVVVLAPQYAGEVIRIHSVAGHQIVRTEGKTEYRFNLAKGIYILSIGQQSVKVAL